MSEKVDTFIIGAGPAGLTAAYTLVQKNKKVLIIERDPKYVGGISRTVSYKDFLFDIGGHRFFSKSKEINDLWHEILPNDFLKRKRLSRIFYDGKFYSYPLKGFEALYNLGILTSIQCLLSFFWARIFPIKPAKSFHQWIRNEFGEKLFNIFFRTYTEKVWGMSCDEISADWASQRIKGLSLGKAILSAFFKNFSTGRIKTLTDVFDYPRKGPGMMWNAVSLKVIEKSGQIFMGHELVSLKKNNVTGEWIVVICNKNNDKKEFIARDVISSAPIPELLSKIIPVPKSLIVGEKLKYRDYLTVVLIVKKKDLFPDNWIYIHDSSVKVGRIQNYRSWSPELVPDPELSSLGLEYFCFENDDLWSLKDDALKELAIHEICKIGLIEQENVIDFCVVRQSKAYPVYDDYYKQRLSEIRKDIMINYEGLHLVGRNGMHKYNNQDHAMMTGILTAKNILLGKNFYNVWGVNEDAEYHESVDNENEGHITERMVPKKIKDNYL
jgi:protoporphyrinogen oxidase